MDSHRHLNTGSTTTSDLFICFTSRLSSSSSMNISNSSADHPISLSTSLSRRLKPNATPIFPNKKRAGNYENPEPSSPKVTCIGQVRMKTKKQRNTLRRRHTGEFSFRNVELRNNHDQNHSYQQSICEALRSIGAEFSCLFPCKSSCFSREKGRWLVAVHDGEEEKRSGDEEQVLPVRRHVFDNLEIDDLMPKVNNEDIEEGRVSICVPPKNALLLMRCRSDPVKMEDLTNRFWISSLQVDEVESSDVNEFDEEKRNSVHVSYEEQVTRDAESKIEHVENSNEELQSNVDVVTEEEDELVNPLIVTDSAIGGKNEEVTNCGKESHERKSKSLPDCLLLMMCEPKLSMEVSKETWVCSTDFIRWKHDKKVKQNNGGDQTNKRISVGSNCKPPLSQPPRSSCSYPAHAPLPEPEDNVSMARVIEQKLVSAVGCEPFILTRCKSAPLRVAQESCLRKNGNLEPHRRSSVSLSTAALDFESRRGIF